MKLYVCNGHPQVGKTFFMDYCKKYIGLTCMTFSTIDPIKQLLKEVGWDGEKTPKARKALSDIKKILTEFNNYPFTISLKIAKTFASSLENLGIGYTENEATIFIDCREPSEIEKFKQAGARTILITRPNMDLNHQEYSNESDIHVNDYDYDITINNNGSKTDFEKKIRSFVKREKIYVCKWD